MVSPFDSFSLFLLGSCTTFHVSDRAISVNFRHNTEKIGTILPFFGTSFVLGARTAATCDLPDPWSVVCCWFVVCLAFTEAGSAGAGFIFLSKLETEEDFLLSSNRTFFEVGDVFEELLSNSRLATCLSPVGAVSYRGAGRVKSEQGTGIGHLPNVKDRLRFPLTFSLSALTDLFHASLMALTRFLMAS